MFIGVMSDTHGNIEFMQRAARLMTRQFGVEAIVHLGDDYADAMKMERAGRPLFAVPGMYEAAWEDVAISHRVLEAFGGVTFLLSHTPTKDPHDRTDDIDPAAAKRLGADVLLHGHTHRYSVGRSPEDVILICPGHLKGHSDKGRPPTFAVIEVERPALHVQFVGLDGAVLEGRRMKVGA